MSEGVSVDEDKIA